MSEWLSREEALERLKVRPQTLYAYVSRGRIGMRPDRADPRRSQYRADDIAALATRRARGRSPSAIAESAIAWGEPSIVTSISTVVHGRLVYRGQDAVALSETRHAGRNGRACCGLCLNRWLSQRHRRMTPDQAGRADAFAQLAVLAGQGRPSLGRSAASLHADAAHAVGVLASRLGRDRRDRIRSTNGWRRAGRSMRRGGSDPPRARPARRS